jgi:O-antigen/teichoic acid export membrane protein
MDAGTPPTVASAATQHDTTKKHIRGSSLLLVGRLISVALDFASQVLIVRYLSKSDYGAFAYALSVISLCSSLAVFGMDKSVARFAPIYQEQRDYNKLFGLLIMMVGTVVSLGLAIVLLFYGLQEVIAHTLISDQQAVVMLLILIVLAPIQALDSLIGGMFNTFASPRAIFFRRHVLGPGLQFSAVLLLVLGQSTAYFLAGGYLAAGAVAITINTIILFRLLRHQKLFQHFNLRSIKMPAREVFSFTTPLLVTDLVAVLRGSLVVVMLEYFQNTTGVAEFRAVLPLARQNMVVMQNFAFLFTPLAARMFARNDRDGIDDLYWQSALWIAILSFPIFAATFSVAQPLTVLIFGSRYADSAVILVLLSLGHYFNAALGFNGLTLRVFGKVRYIFLVDLLSALASVGINLLLIPWYGALGAAIGICVTMVAQNIFYQIGFHFGTGIKMFRWRYFKVYFSIVMGSVGLLLIQVFISPNMFISFALAAFVSVLVLGINRRALKLGQTFPELRRFPLARRLFGR